MPGLMLQVRQHDYCVLISHADDTRTLKLARSLCAGAEQRASWNHSIGENGVIDREVKRERPFEITESIRSWSTCFDDRDSAFADLSLD